MYTGYLLKKPIRAVEFNKTTGVFWIEKLRVFGWKVGESAQMPLSQVRGLQIVSYTNREAYHYYKDQLHEQDLLVPSHVSADQETVTEYEINVVFANQERVNVVNHRDRKAIKRDVTTLANFLEVPVWDKYSALQNRR